MADDVTLEFGAKIDKLIQAVDDVNRKLGTIGDATQNLDKQFGFLDRIDKRVREVVGIFGEALGAIEDFTRGMAATGVAAQRVYSSIGGTGESILNVKAAAALAGTDLETLITSLGRSSLAVQRSTTTAFDPAAQALKVLGLNAKELIGIPVDQYMFKLVDAVSKLEPSLNRTNAVQTLGIRNFQALLPVLDLGRDKLAKFTEEYKRAGAGVDPRAFAETNAELILLDRAFDRIGKNIFAVVGPAINLVIQKFREYLLTIRPEDIKAAVVAAVDAVLDFAAAAVVAYEMVKQKVQEVWKVTSDYWDTIKAMGAGIKAALIPTSLGSSKALSTPSTVGQFLSKIMEDNVAGLEAGTPGWVARIKEKMNEIKGALHLDTTSGSALSAVLGGISGLTPRAQAGAIDFGEQQRLQLTQTRIQGQIALEQGFLERKKSLYEIDESLGVISTQKRISLSIDAATKEFEIEREKLQKIRDLWPKQTQQWEAANQALIQASQKFNLEMVKQAGDALKDIKSKFDDVFGALQSSINGSLRQILAGTMSFKEAFRNIIGDMIIFFIQAIEKMVFNWIAGQIAMALSPASAAAKAAVFTSDITAGAARVYAGVFANLAPLLGPAAAAPAEAASGSVLAQLAFIPKFDVGSWSVPQDMLAMVHEGERITPAGVQGGGWQGGGGGGGNTVVIQTMDARGVAAFVNEHAGALSDAVARHQTNNPSSRGRW